MRKLYFILLVLLCSCAQNSHNSINSPLEKNNFTKLTSNAELFKFINLCSEKSDFITIDTIGYSESGKPIPLLKIANKNIANKKVNVLFFAQQHGNEPSGKEGLIRMIKEITNKNQLQLFDSINLLIIPQCNPDGGDSNIRRNAKDIDLNRDHLLLKSKEAQFIQSIFMKYKPEFTVDFHEYYPYSDGWKEFGYRRDFDIQFGGLTNINVDSTIRKWFYSEALPSVKNKLEKNNFKFGEYTLGYFPEGERLRHSTIDVNDGRQSMGIAQTMSFIVEGIRGKDSIESIKSRCESQYLTALALAETAFKNNTYIRSTITDLRNTSFNKSDSISIRQEHFKGKKPLKYSLWDIKNKKDTVFIVTNYQSVVKSLLAVKKPFGYLIPKNDSLLTNWLLRSNFDFSEANISDKKVFAYTILALNKSIDEDLENYYALVEKTDLTDQINFEDYYFVPSKQFLYAKVITALEPQAMYGLANYKDFNYLLDNKAFPILRVE